MQVRGVATAMVKCGVARRQEDWRWYHTHIGVETLISNKGTRAYACIICAAVLQLPALASKFLQRCRRR